MEPTQQRFSIVYCILTFVVLLLLQAVLFAPHTENLSYRDFKVLLKAGKVEDLSLGERTITGRLQTEGLEGLLPAEKIKELQQYGKGEHRFITVKVEDPALVPEQGEVDGRTHGQGGPLGDSTRRMSSTSA